MSEPAQIQYGDFVAAFPEFSNATTYPEAQFNFWAPLAYKQLNAFRFDVPTLGLAAMLFVAHNIVLSARAAAQGAAGGVVGGTVAPMSSKTVDKVSASYDTGAVTIAGAGPYNATNYGQRLYKLMDMYSAGPMYVPGNFDDPAAVVGYPSLVWPF